jgi:hypothetical protein
MAPASCRCGAQAGSLCHRAWFFWFPSSRLGTHVPAKLCLAIGYQGELGFLVKYIPDEVPKQSLGRNIVPKQELGNEKGMRSAGRRAVTALQI